jgi:glutamate--cysteine ligase
MLARQADETSALIGPKSDLERQILKAAPAIEHWLHEQWQKHAAPFYASVDLRNSGYKLAPVDINLFPGGFNNLNPDTDPQCLQVIVATVKKTCPSGGGLLLIPENHTRNPGYMENVVALQTMLRRAGIQVRVGSLDPTLAAATDIESTHGAIRLEPLRRYVNRLGVDDFDPCLVLLNNDLSAGVPDILRNIEQPLLPPLYAGWTTRRKSNHFAIYRNLAAEVAGLIGIDSWLINANFSKCGSINFHERTGEECLEAYVLEVLAAIRLKYKQYGITQEPFVIVKADAGTYGMAVMTVKDPSEVHSLNRKQRKKMEMAKGHAEVHEVMVQEGVYTSELVEGSSAEPVIYMVDKFVVGGYYRVTAGRGQDENLNVPGSHFVTVPFDKPCHFPDSNDPQSSSSRFHAYGLIARIALVATAIELEQAREASEKNAAVNAPAGKDSIPDNSAARP